MSVIGALKPPLTNKETAVTSQLLPQRIDNTYRGYRLALWLLVLVVSVRIFQSLMVIFNGPSIAVSADGIPLDTYSPEAAQTILSLFALSGLARLIMSLLGVLALVRYRGAIPLVFALLGFDYLARQLVLYFIPIVRTGSVLGPTINLVLFALTIVGLALSLLRRGNLETR
jgi:hypothetical protein